MEIVVFINLGTFNDNKRHMYPCMCHYNVNLPVKVAFVENRTSLLGHNS